jgi:tetratricopeptide (TPR) repeat protein
LLEARTSSESLLRQLKKQGWQAEAPFLSALALAYSINGHIQAMTRRTREIHVAIQQYQEQAKLARALDNQTLLSFALSYQGDLLRRKGDIAQALACLSQAREITPAASACARGNNALQLALVHLTNRDYPAFLAEIATAEELAQIHEAIPHPALTQFCLGAVYIEYGRGYSFLGNRERSQHYLQQAEALLPTGNLWYMQLHMTQAEILVRMGDVTNAMPLLMEVAHLAHMYGHQRLLERLYRLQYILDDQATLFRQASRSLSEILYGPVELA